jgi:hypothetical protein
MFCGIIFFEHGWLSICKYVQTHWLFILSNSSFGRLGYQIWARTKIGIFELPHINRLVVLYGMSFFEHM